MLHLRCLTGFWIQLWHDSRTLQVCVLHLWHDSRTSQVCVLHLWHGGRSFQVWVLHLWHGSRTLQMWILHVWHGGRRFQVWVLHLWHGSGTLQVWILHFYTVSIELSHSKFILRCWNVNLKNLRLILFVLMELEINNLIGLEGRFTLTPCGEPNIWNEVVLIADPPITFSKLLR